MTAEKYIESKKDLFISDLKRLVEINSVRSAEKPGMPFGEGGARALSEAEKILSEHGYRAENYGNYAVEADLGKNPCLMLLAHLDVVPEGDGWTREPYKLTVEGSKAYGRGTTDDKGAAVACILAMDACREAYGEPKTGVRLVLGGGEETGSEDMEHYFSLRPVLKYTLSPDADYPLINIEKGRFAPRFTKNISFTDEKIKVLKIVGGDTDNIVAGKAYALVEGISVEEAKKQAERTKTQTGVDFEIHMQENCIKIQANGITAHAAAPQNGNNANTALLIMLNGLFTKKCEFSDTVSGILKLLPHNETTGESIGVKMSDEESGALTLNFGVLGYDGKALTCGLDLRCPLCANENNVKNVIKEKINSLSFDFVGEPEMRPVHCVSKNSGLVKTLLGVYEKHTGKKGECLAIGGGTYVHDIDGGVAFGVEFPDKDYRIHGADEYCDIDEMLLTASMYADVIKELCY